MSDYIIRPATLDDIEIVYQLITEQNKLDFGEPLRTMDSIRQGWNSPNFNLEFDSFVAITSNGNIVGYAELQDKEDIFAYLASQNQDSGLANHLLELLEERARSQEIKPAILYTQVGYRNSALIENFDSNGFISDLSFLVMEIVMAKQPRAPEWPDGIVPRAFVPNQDEQATYQADEEAGKDKGYHSSLSYEKWIRRMGMDRKNFDPSIWHIAWDKNEIVGVALNILNEYTNTGWVDHLSVRRAWRNKGIGKALLLHTFGEFFKRGIHTVKLSVDSKSLTNAPRLYESVGMKTVEKYHIYKKVL